MRCTLKDAVFATVLIATVAVLTPAMARSQSLTQRSVADVKAEIQQVTPKAEAGDSAAEEQLAGLYYKLASADKSDRGVRHSAWEWQIKAADAGNPEAQFWVGQQDRLLGRTKAMDYIKKAADQGYGLAQGAIANFILMNAGGALPDECAARSGVCYLDDSSAIQYFKMMRRNGTLNDLYQTAYAKMTADMARGEQRRRSNAFTVYAIIGALLCLIAAGLLIYRSPKGPFKLLGWSALGGFLGMCLAFVGPFVAGLALLVLAILAKTFVGSAGPLGSTGLDTMFYLSNLPLAEANQILSLSALAGVIFISPVLLLRRRRGERKARERFGA